MASGQPLTDVDRAPWLRDLNAALRAHEPAGAVLACSALRQGYRDVIFDGLTARRVIYLEGRSELSHARLEHRAGHFMPPTLLAS